jgi:hypothetical protein
LATKRVRYCIAKNIVAENRLRRHREFLEPTDEQSLRSLYFGQFRADVAEPFALLHREL